MTYQKIQYDDRPRFFLARATLISVSLLCGCASNTIDQAVPVATIADPQAAPQQPLIETVITTPTPVSTAKNAEQFPNINVVPTGEIAQLTDAQTAATRATLEGEAQVQRQRGESPQAYLARLRKLQKLGSTHAAATLRQIEQSQ